MALRVNCQSGDKTIPVAAEVTIARIIAPKNIPTTDPKPPTMETPPNSEITSASNSINIPRFENPDLNSEDKRIPTIPAMAALNKYR